MINRLMFLFATWVSLWGAVPGVRGQVATTQILPLPLVNEATPSPWSWTVAGRRCTSDCWSLRPQSGAPAPLWLQGLRSRFPVPGAREDDRLQL